MATSMKYEKFFYRFEHVFDSGVRMKDDESDENYQNQPLVSLEQATDPLELIVFDLKNMVFYAKQRCKRSSSHHLTVDQSAAIFLYTMEWSPADTCLFQVLNRTLREGNRDQLKPWLLYLKLFTSALTRLPSVNQTIYRGIKMTLPTDYREGTVIVWKCFSSCTKTMGTLDSDRFLGLTGPRILLAIDCYSGKSVREYSAYPSEDEVILVPNRNFQVIAILKQAELTIVQLKEIESSKPKSMFVSTASHNFSMSTPIITSHSNRTWEQNGLTIAGGKKEGSSVEQLHCPHGIYVDDNSQMVFVADTANHRIIAWKLGTNDIRMIIGHAGKGDRLNQLNAPTDLLMDKDGSSLIISDSGNSRVVRWLYDHRTGTASNQGKVIIAHIHCQGIAMDDQRNLYVSDYEKHQVKRLRPFERKGETVAGGNGEGKNDDQLNRPSYIFVTADQTVYVSDEVNDRIMRWTKGSTRGVVVAGHYSYGSRIDQLWFPRGLWVNENETVFIADSLNHRIVSWNNGERQGQLVVGGRGGGSKADQLLGPQGICFDRQGDLYVVDRGNARVQKYFLN